MKIRIIACVLAAVFVFCGASVWEGQAEMAGSGQLPDSGSFVATNSFPRNSVVEITNINNNRTIRGIVISGNDNPWLPVLLSQEAAKMLGLSNGTRVPVKITQPSDATTYLRFTEGSPSAEAPAPVPAAAAPPAAPPVIVTRSESIPAVIAEERRAEPEPVYDNSFAGASPYFLEREWDEGGPGAGAGFPVYVAEAQPAAVVPPVAEPVFVEEEESEPEFIAEEEPPVEEEPEVLVEEAEPEPEFIAEEEPPVEEEPEVLVEEAEPEPEFIAEEEPPVEEVTEVLAEEVEPEPEFIAEEYTLVPTDERPPEVSEIYGIDPESIIPGIGLNEPAVEPTPPAEIARPSDRPADFTAPTVGELKRGSYYVQLAAFTSPELVQSAINNIDNVFNPLVYLEETSRETVYRVLLGPLNQGESGAVLQRFKSIGYKDAFVRKGN